MQIPDYFLALVCQYSGALNSEQASRYVMSVVDALYMSSQTQDKTIISSNLPQYLKPKKHLFNSVPKPSINSDQDAIFNSRLIADLSKTDPNEIKQIATGVFKSLKIVTSQRQKFDMQHAIKGRALRKLYIES
jgi:fibrillarin-like rRNA methylase